MTAARVLSLSLGVAVVDCAYLSWRFLALHGAPSPWVVPHTGICSWTAGIDCDRVLITPEARAFFVPNATLGLGFFVGAAYWWFVGARRYPAHRVHLARTLAFWLGVASLITLRFWSLLVRLPALCPFCPWNHAFTYVAFGASIALWRKALREQTEALPPWRALLPHTLRAVAPLVLTNALWGAMVATGVIDAGPTIARQARTRRSGIADGTPTQHGRREWNGTPRFRAVLVPDASYGHRDPHPDAPNGPAPRLGSVAHPDQREEKGPHVVHGVVRRVARGDPAAVPSAAKVRHAAAPAHARPAVGHEPAHDEGALREREGRPAEVDVRDPRARGAAHAVCRDPVGHRRDDALA